MPTRLQCVVSHTAPTWPTCVCGKYENGASSLTTDGLCQKNLDHGETICYPRNYAGELKTGGAEFYGCPASMCAVTHQRPHTLTTRTRRPCRDPKLPSLPLGEGEAASGSRGAMGTLSRLHPGVVW